MSITSVYSFKQTYLQELLTNCDRNLLILYHCEVIVIPISPSTCSNSWTPCYSSHSSVKKHLLVSKSEPTSAGESKQTNSCIGSRQQLYTLVFVDLCVPLPPFPPASSLTKCVPFSLVFVFVFPSLLSISIPSLVFVRILFCRTCYLPRGPNVLTIRKKKENNHMGHSKWVFYHSANTFRFGNLLHRNRIKVFVLILSNELVDRDTTDTLANLFSFLFESYCFQKDSETFYRCEAINSQLFSDPNDHHDFHLIIPNYSWFLCKSHLKSLLNLVAVS